MGVTVLQTLVVGDHDEGGLGRFPVKDVHDSRGVVVVQG